MSLAADAAELGRRYYRFLFKLPRQGIIVATSLAIVLLLWFSEGAKSILAVGGAVALISGIVRKPLLSTKRITALLAVLGAFSLISSAIARVTGVVHDTLLAVYSPTIVIGGLICLGFAGLKGVVSYVLLYDFYLSLITPQHLGFILLYSLPILVLLLLLLNRVGVDGLNVVRALLISWLDDDYSLLEKIAEKHGSRGRTVTHIVTLHTEDNCVHIVIPRVHFGPFRRAGSSSLPYIILDMLSKSKTIVFHSDVGHKDNLVLRRDAERLAFLIKEEAARMCKDRDIHKDCSILVARPTQVHGVRVIPLPISSVPVIVVDRPGKGIDDIDVDERKGCIVIDAHNETLSSTVALEDVVKAVNVSCKETLSYKNCMIGYYTYRVDQDLVEELGLCKNWLQVVVIDCNSIRKGVVVFPTNNASKGAREIVERILLSHGIDGTLVTIDDHECVGLYPGVAERTLTSSKVLEKITETAVIEALKRMQKIIGCGHSIVEAELLRWNSFYAYLNNIASKIKPLAPLSIMLIPLSLIIPLIYSFFLKLLFF